MSAATVDPNGYPDRGDGLCDAEGICYLLANLGMSVRPGTLRVWAHRGLITSRGRDRYGRSLYNVHEVATHAENRRSATHVRTVL